MPGLSISLAQSAPIPLDLSFDCKPGELLALVGPSGSGKSTILRAIAGLNRIEQARVDVAGETWTDTARSHQVPTHARRVGLVFQSYALFPHMTAAANIAAAMSHLTEHARQARARELMALVNLSGLEERRPAELSGGQQQRVAVARALAREPQVLLLDEPFSAVDKVTRGRLYQELAGLRHRLAMPIVLVTHDLDEALMLADSMCLIQRGRIVQHGAPLDIVNHPQSVEAARLVGHRNIFPARVVEHRADPPRTILGWRGQRIEAAHQPRFAPGADVSWLIPPSKVVLHRRDKPSRGEAENPVEGTVERFTALGDTTISTVKLASAETRALTMHLPRHAAERNGIAAGARVTLSLIADAIHLMPAPGASHHDTR